ncbi:hypothetical protein [Loktanella sp. SALINAS62]|uniref:hypothetical protein n=1 Tax=Loktanella sp. SALINAS62 TaxID=2706124 RepID=UPI001B8DA209|nr:hypothetical protein [Loktanella sp. SALINAS62]MBS1303904.1 hypothetical protein [Loktanella sp. SALINAS62]
MTPRFAFTLSSDAICLLHRVPEGWNRVGNVPLDSPDLAGALADLRADGLRLEPDGIQTKLVLPDDQIKFMSLDGTQTTVADVRGALDGATPYKIDELAIDFERSGGQTHIAAVARETLAEAEAFAVQHKFNPVCFVAVPQPGTFVTEVFFGPTQAAKGLDVTRDAEPVQQTGVADLSAQDTDQPTTDDTDDTEIAAQITSEDTNAELPTFNARPRGPQTAGPLAAGAMPGGNAPGDLTPPAAPATSAPAVGLSGGKAPESPVTKAPLSATRATPVSGAPDELLFTRRKEPPPPIVGKARAASPDARRADAGPVLTATPAMAAVAADPQTTVTPKTQPVAAPSPDPRPAPRAKATTDGLNGLGARTSGKPRFLGLILTGALLVVLLILGLWASTLPDEGIAWLWGGDDTVVAEVSDDDGPAVSTTEQASNAEPAVPPTDPVEQNAAPVPAVDTPDPAARQLPVVRAQTTGVLSPAEADRIYAATGVYQRAPRIPAMPRASIDETQRPVSIPLAGIDSATAPRLPDFSTTAPDPVIADQVNPPGPDVVFARDVRGLILATPDGTILPNGGIVFAGAPDLRPQLRPGTPTVVDAPAASLRTDPNAPEDVRLIVGPPPLQPRLRPAGLAPAAEDAAATTPQTQIAIDTPAGPATDTDTPVVAGAPDLRPSLRPGDLAPPQASLTVDTPTDTNAASDAPAVIQGAPDQRPPLRPASFATRSVPAAPVVDPRVADARPALRPTDLAPAEEEAAAEPDAVAQAVAEAELVPQADINAIAAAIASAAPPSSFTNRTARAVGVAPRPGPRPRNFDRVVARATAAPTQRQTAAVVQRPATTPQVTAPATVAPSGPVSGGVARAATLENAINLRNINLVGVYGRPNARRALVRLGNGRYVKVEVGSRLDGGRVTAIGDSALNFVKGGRTYALQLPTG